MRSENGFTLLEIIIVITVFVIMTFAINNVIFSAQNIWSSSSAFSKLEDEALRITKMLSKDLSSSAVMWAPSSTGFSFDNRLPNIPITGGSTTSGYYGDSIIFLIPKFDSTGKPLIAATANYLGVDWDQSYVVNYYTVPQTGGKLILSRNCVNVSDSTDTKTDVLTKNLVSIKFRDKDTDSSIPSFYVVRYEIVLKEKGLTKDYTIKRCGSAYLRNSSGSSALAP